MPLFFLKKGFAALSAPEGGGRVVHQRTGDSLEVPASEVLLLARATVQGLDSTDPDVRTVVRKYTDLGLLVPDSRPAAMVPLPLPAMPAPAPEPAAPLPRLHPALKVNQRGNSSVFDVTRPDTGRTFQLYDFELSLARMLDGKRSHAEAVDAAQRLGIPVTLESLGKFLGQLDRYGFLVRATDTAAPAESESWSARTRWDEAVRTMFQSGLKMYRHGRYAEAAGYFDAMLEQDPKNPEALEMRAQVQLRLAGGLAPEAPPLPPSDRPLENFDELRLEDGPGELSAPAPPATLPPVAEVVPMVAPMVAPSPVRPAAPSPSGARPRPSPAEPLPPAPPPLPAQPLPVAEPAPAEMSVSPEDLFPMPPPGTAPAAQSVVVTPAPAPASAGAHPLLLAGGGVAALLVGVAIYFAVRPPAPPPARPPAPAVLIAKPPTLPPELPLAVADADAGAPIAAAPAPPEAADAGVAPAPVPEGAWAEFKIGKRGRVKMAEVVAPAAGTLSWKAQPEQRVKRNEVVATLQPAEGDAVKLTAAQEGLVVPKDALPLEAQAGEVLAALLYFEAYLLTDVTGVQPVPGWRCEVVSKAAGASAPCNVVKVAPRGEAVQVTATLEPRWFDAATDAVLRLAPP